MTQRIDASQLAAQFRRVEVELERAVPQALMLLSQLVASRAKGTRLFRDRTGNLRASIRQGPVRGSLASGFRVDVIAGGVGGVRYARWVHDGTRRTRPRQFMTQALESIERGGEAQRVLDQAVNLALQRAGF